MDPDLGGKLPYGSGSFMDIFVAIEKCSQIGTGTSLGIKSLKLIKYSTFSKSSLDLGMKW
jgi:hypothetical protein